MRFNALSRVKSMELWRMSSRTAEHSIVTSENHRTRSAPSSPTRRHQSLPVKRLRERANGERIHEREYAHKQREKLCKMHRAGNASTAYS